MYDVSRTHRTHPLGRSSEDHVALLQCERLAQVADQERQREDHVFSVSLLFQFSIYL